MKRWMVAAVVVAAASVFAVGALAKEKKEGRPDCKKGQDMKALFAKWDANGDGKVSKEEFLAAQQGKGKKEGQEKKFAKMDTDGDEILSMDEFKAGCAKKQEKKAKPE